jgi:hypothetical protein
VSGGKQYRQQQRAFKLERKKLDKYKHERDYLDDEQSNVVYKTKQPRAFAVLSHLRDETLEEENMTTTSLRTAPAAEPEVPEEPQPVSTPAPSLPPRARPPLRPSQDATQVLPARSADELNLLEIKRLLEEIKSEHPKQMDELRRGYEEEIDELRKELAAVLKDMDSDINSLLPNYAQRESRRAIIERRPILESRSRPAPAVAPSDTMTKEVVWAWLKKFLSGQK